MISILYSLVGPCELRSRATTRNTKSDNYKQGTTLIPASCASGLALFSGSGEGNYPSTTTTLTESAATANVNADANAYANSSEGFDIGTQTLLQRSVRTERHSLSSIQHLVPQDLPSVSLSLSVLFFVSFCNKRTTTEQYCPTGIATCGENHDRAPCAMSTPSYYLFLARSRGSRQ